MTIFALIAILLTVTALLSWVNARLIHLPPTIGVMTAALCLSLLLIALGRVGLGVDRWAEALFAHVDFDTVLMQGMLSFLLFAGALHVDLGALLERKWTIASLATVGVMISTFLVGTTFFYVLQAFGDPIPYTWALLFGALISPTDPVAVLGILKNANAPHSLEIHIVGESLFNDGVGVVVYAVLLGFVVDPEPFSLPATLGLLAEEALGGAMVGAALGWLAYRLLREIDDYSVEILITLALVSGGYALAGAIHTSGPIAMVVAGLFIGNHGRAFGMSERTREHLDAFWEMLDELLNALLFVMIGLELLVLDVERVYLAIGLVAIAIVLLARTVSVAVPISAIRAFRPIEAQTIRVLSWAGIRGGISIALALGLPASPARDLILVVTYTVVVFSILVQGLTVGRVVRWVTANTRTGA
ncbi:MAG TPA: sodium:proton antiporter [Candidatus Polarisedimenticolaceae bacterium]|nr:sodium:proton antiporter [Candidatus Polarisedimenticolaceae bacterium]